MKSITVAVFALLGRTTFHANSAQSPSPSQCKINPGAADRERSEPKGSASRGMELTGQSLVIATARMTISSWEKLCSRCCRYASHHGR